MKHYICILVIALVHRATCFPVGEPAAGISPNGPSLTPEMKGADVAKSDTPIMPIASALPDKADIIPGPSVPQKQEVTGGEAVSPSPAPEAEKSVAKEVAPMIADAPKPSSPVAVTAEAEQPSTATAVKSIADAVKSEVPAAEVPAAERAEMTNKIVAEPQVAVSSETPKEANNQVNSVSVDEPKPVRNEVKSEIPKEEKVAADEQIKVEKIKDEKMADAVKSENVKEEVKGVVADQVKSEKVAEEVTKVDAVKNVAAVSGEEMKPSSVSSEESVRKGDVSGSEEKNASVERVVLADEKRESEEKKESSAEEKRESSSSEEVKEDAKPTEKPAEEPKKEEKKPEEKKEEKKETVVKDEKKELRDESSVKPIAESQVLESAKPSTVATVTVGVAHPSSDPVTEKVDVIKREAGKETKNDEKKPTEVVKKEKLQIKGGSSVQKDDEIKSSKGQDKIVN